MYMEVLALRTLRCSSDLSSLPVAGPVLSQGLGGLSKAILVLSFITAVDSSIRYAGKSDGEYFHRHQLTRSAIRERD
jgi:hypothetical protein